MNAFILSKNNTQKFISEILSKYPMVAPVKTDEDTAFTHINTPADISFQYSNTTMPPKNLLFQQTETLFKFTVNGKIKIEPTENSDKITVVFGIRPCDAKSFVILDHVFNGDFKDPYYLHKRKNTLLIGLSCTQPETNCFCTTFKDSPASSEHVDVLLTDIGENYFVEVKNDKGKDLIKNVEKLLTPASEKDIKKKKEVEKKAIEKIERSFNVNGVADKFDNIFDNELWKKTSLKCIGCSACTYLCPTCHCFDIQDENAAKKGARVRMWDTCMRPEYTLHASGHNPRPERKNRLRNRFYHKYNYYPKNFGIIACVGCGRCIDNCPVNIDIVDVITTAQGVKP